MLSTSPHRVEQTDACVNITFACFATWAIIKDQTKEIKKANIKIKVSLSLSPSLGVYGPLL